jgi:SAM-dependent methyltransferase
MSNLFDGPGAALVGRIMARRNAAAEAEAIDLLAPAPDAHVLVLGFGPGVGVEMLAERLSEGFVLGADPSAVMVRQATHRNRRWIELGRVRLERATADQLCVDEGAFDGAIAVNSLQLCEPIAPTAAMLACALRPGAALVSLTHDWAAEKHAASAEDWLGLTGAALAAAGLGDVRSFRADAEGGRALALIARRGGA